MIYVLLFLGLVFFGLGYLLTVENARYILSGYNTMSREDQDKFDIQGYVPFFRKFHRFLGLSLIGIGLLIYLVSETAAGVFMTVYPFVAWIWFFMKTRKYSNGLSNKSNKWAIGVLALTLIFVVGLLLSGFQKNKIEIGSNQMEINGKYGEIIPLSDIVEMNLVENLPPIKMKSNGFAVGKIRKGYFKTNSGERIKILVDTEEKPILQIVLRDSSKIYYASGGVSAAATKDAIAKANSANK